MNDTDAARLRDLQRRAFAPGGGLTDAEAAELRSLTAAQSAAPRGSAQRVGAGDPDHTASGAATPATSTSAESAAAPGESGPTASGTSSSDASGPEVSASDTLDSSARRRGWTTVLVATVAALLLGVGVGWFVFGRPAAPAAMSAEDSAAQEFFAKDGGYDPGSLRFQGSKDGASVWLATKDDGRQRCIAMSVGDERAAECAPIEGATTQPGQASMNLNVSGDGEGESWMYWAVAIEDIHGKSTVIVQRDRGGGNGNWEDQYTSEQRRLAQAIVDAGADPNQIYIVGYDGDLPIWASMSVPRCLYVVNADQLWVSRKCEEQGEPVVLSVGPTTYRLADGNHGPTLTIERLEIGAEGE